MDDKEQELEKRYLEFLAREKAREKAKEAQKGIPTKVLEAADVVNLTEEETKRGLEVVNQARAKVRQNLLDVFYIDMQIASDADKNIATNKKLRYEFAKEFIQKHWSACIDAKIKLKDLLNV